MMAADSRSSWDKGLDSSDNLIIYAHTDNVRKIFPFGYYQIMYTGISVYKNIPIESLIDDFNKKTNPDSGIVKTFDRFQRYVERRLKISYSAFTITKYLVGGYENSIPTIMWHDSSGNTILHPVGGRFYSVAIAKSYYYTMFPVTCENHIGMVEDMFDSVSSKEIMVGGPINVIKISNDNSITELKTFEFKKTYKTQNDYFNDIVRGNVKIVYHYKWSEDFLMRGIKCALKCDKCY